MFSKDCNINTNKVIQDMIKLLETTNEECDISCKCLFCLIRPRLTTCCDGKLKIYTFKCCNCEKKMCNECYNCNSYGQVFCEICFYQYT